MATTTYQVSRTDTNENGTHTLILARGLSEKEARRAAEGGNAHATEMGRDSYYEYAEEK